MKAVIIEDEEIISRVLLNKIKNIDPGIDVIEVIPSLKVAKKWFMNNAEPDMLFMDIQLSDGVSFELLEQFKLNCPIVFTTAYDEYAIRAFKVNGIDYLLKPIDDDDLRNAIEKCKALTNGKAGQVQDLEGIIKFLSSSANTNHRYKERFIVNVRNQWMPVATKDIACFVKENINYIYLLNGERYIIDYSTLDDVEELLDPHRFYRANRQFIINLDAIHTVRPVENSKLTIQLKAPNQKFQIDMSREKAPVFKKWIDQ